MSRNGNKLRLGSDAPLAKSIATCMFLSRIINALRGSRRAAEVGRYRVCGLVMPCSSKDRAPPHLCEALPTVRMEMELKKTILKIVTESMRERGWGYRLISRALVPSLTVLGPIEAI